MKTAHCIFVLIFIINVTFYSCKPKPCTPEPDVYDFITPEYLTKIPYKNFAELTFINVITKDTHVFYGQGWDSSYSYQRDYSYECRGGIYYETKTQLFTSPTYNYPLYFGLEAGGEYLQVDLLKYKFYLWAGNIRKPYSFDSLFIQNKLYFDVKYFKNQKEPQWNTQYGCYYNTTYGILKIELPEGNLELVKLKN